VGFPRPFVDEIERTVQGADLVEVERFLLPNSLELCKGDMLRFLGFRKFRRGPDVFAKEKLAGSQSRGRSERFPPVRLGFSG
jgi:hypothetical protein